jgi:hypothetical protein
MDLEFPLKRIKKEVLPMKINRKWLEKRLAKTKAVQTGEEIRAFAAESEIELSPDMLELVSGGLVEGDAYWLVSYCCCGGCGGTNLYPELFTEN